VARRREVLDARPDRWRDRRAGRSSWPAASGEAEDGADAYHALVAGLPFEDGGGPRRAEGGGAT
jgi:hypothetical protein